MIELIQYKKVTAEIKGTGKSARYVLNIDGERMSMSAFRSKHQCFGSVTITNRIKKKGNRGLTKFVNDALYKEYRGISQRGNVFRLKKSGKRFILKDISEKAGIDITTAYRRIELWDKNNLPDEYLFEKKHQGRNKGTMHSKLPSLNDDSRKHKLKFIPGPTTLERKYL
jgi:hypothetical protein